MGNNQITYDQIKETKLGKSKVIPIVFEQKMKIYIFFIHKTLKYVFTKCITTNNNKKIYNHIVIDDKYFSDILSDKEKNSLIGSAINQLRQSNDCLCYNLKQKFHKAINCVGCKTIEN